MRIRDLYVYPVKSLRGVRVPELAIERDGPRLDRQWMLVDDRGVFLTQRTHPGLARVAVSVGEDKLRLTHDGTSIDFGLDASQGPEFEVTLHGQKFQAVEVSTPVSDWVTEVVGRPTRLVRWVEGRHREFAAGVTDFGVRFADQKPLLVISTASLEDLNARVGRELEMIRFRPNVVVEGAEAYAEDEWESFTALDQNFRRLKACVRCRITTVDPLTGEVGPEPLRTLLTYRRTPKGLAFGSYYGHIGTGILRTGAEVFTPALTSV